MALLKILVIEDNFEQIELLKLRLSKFTYPSEIKIMETGEEGLAYLKESLAGDNSFWFPELIFLDLNLPGQHGIEILKQMKTMLGKALPPVIIVSATDSKKDQADCYKAGAACFLPKPYHQEPLNNVMIQLRMTGRLKVPAV